MNMDILMAFVFLCMPFIVLKLILFSYDKQEFNKGICPKCNNKFSYKGKYKRESIYMCKNCNNVVTTDSKYLNYKYGRECKGER